MITPQDVNIGDQIVIWCGNYYYEGVVSRTPSVANVQLDNCYVVYQTGEFTRNDWERAEKLPERYQPFHVAQQSIESFGVLNKK